MKNKELCICNRCLKNKKNSNRTCFVELIEKRKITRKNYCRKGWVVNKYKNREVVSLKNKLIQITGIPRGYLGLKNLYSNCVVEKRYLRKATIEELLEL